MPRQRNLREIAHPYMENLLLATRETVHFAIHDGLEVLYVEKLVVHRGLNKQSRIAGRLRRQLGRARTERLAVEVEETRLGYMSMAVPVFAERDALAGALSITAPTSRMNLGRFTGGLRTAANGITRSLQPPF